MPPWKAEPAKAGRKSSATPNHGAYHIFHPPFGFHRVSVPWQQPRCIPWRRHLCAVKVCISQTQQGALYISPAVIRRKTRGVKNRKQTYSNKEQQQNPKNWHGGEVLPCPNLSIVSSSPCHLLQTSCLLQPLLQHGLSHLSSSSTVPKAAFRWLSKMPGQARQGDSLGRRTMPEPMGPQRGPCGHPAWGDQR